MERIRLWLHTLALTALATAALVFAFGGRTLTAAEPARCQLLDSGKLMWNKAADDVVQQAQTLLSGVTEERVAVIPFGRISGGSGGNYAVVCVY